VGRVSRYAGRVNRLFLNAALVFLETFAGRAEPVRIVFDTDMANGCDDTGALADSPTLADRGKPAHDLTVVLVAVRGPEADLWTVVTKGRVVSDSDGHTEWRRDWARRHSYLRIKPHHSRLEEIIGDLLVASPKNR
jgi:hypothetical protein